MAFNSFRVEGDTAFIDLRNRSGDVVAVTLIDAADLPRLVDLNRSWRAHWLPESNEYRPSILMKNPETGRGTTVLLYRYLLDAPKGLQVDHINRDPLDNRRQNLRLVTNAQNQHNKVKARKDSKTGFRGVTWMPKRGQYMARINPFVGTKRVFTVLGYFDTPEEAHEAYKVACNERYSHSPFKKEV